MKVGDLKVNDLVCRKSMFYVMQVSEITENVIYFKIFTQRTEFCIDNITNKPTEIGWDLTRIENDLPDWRIISEKEWKLKTLQ